MANNHSVVKRHRRCKSGKREKQERERILRTVREIQRRAAPIQAIIGQWHDYITMNAHECILDPTPEESERIWRESSIDFA